MEETLMNYVRDQQSKSCQRGNNGMVYQLGSTTGLLMYKASKC